MKDGPQRVGWGLFILSIKKTPIFIGVNRIVKKLSLEISEM